MTVKMNSNLIRNLFVPTFLIVFCYNNVASERTVPVDVTECDFPGTVRFFEK